MCIDFLLEHRWRSTSEQIEDLLHCCNLPSWPRHIVSEVKEETRKIRKKLKPSPKKAEADLWLCEQWSIILWETLQEKEKANGAKKKLKDEDHKTKQSSSTFKQISEASCDWEGVWGYSVTVCLLKIESVINLKWSQDAYRSRLGSPCPHRYTFGYIILCDPLVGDEVHAT